MTPPLSSHGVLSFLSLFTHIIYYFLSWENFLFMYQRSLGSFWRSFHIFSSVLFFVLHSYSPNRNSLKELVWFFDSGPAQGPVFYSPSSHLGQCSIKCWRPEGFSFLATSYSCLLVLCQEFSPKFRSFVPTLNHKSTTLLLDFHCILPLSLFLWIFHNTFLESLSSRISPFTLPRLLLLHFLLFLSLSFLLYLFLYLCVPISGIFSGFPPHTFFLLFSSVLLAPHCFPFLCSSDIKACSLLFLSSCCLFLSLFLLLPRLPISVPSEFFSLLCSLFVYVFPIDVYHFWST